MTCDGVCTYSLMKTKHVKQPFYRCVDCSTESCCVSCIQNCHISHNILYCGIFNGFCDCGLKECENNCKISHKCSFDEHDEHSNVSKMRGFECYTCRGEKSEFSCCETCANECHLGHSLVPLDSTDFICDCGENSHKTKRCTYDQYGNTLKLQEWYSCQTCWSNTSDFGCCKLCAKECHSGHELVLNEAKEFSCDCGLNNHSASHLSAMATSGTACTYGSVKTNIIKQHIYKCHTCKNTHCCTPCIEKCHIGHNVEYSGISSAFCDCGLEYCAIPCKFGSKCTYDQYGSASMNQKWYECLSCWDEGSGYGCCVICAKECHSGHNIVSHESGDFSCDCGANSHIVTPNYSIDAICTYTTTKKEYIDQPFYQCHTCFTESDKGCCKACVENCHRGHDIENSEFPKAFCDCGLECCAIRCKIGSKCTYDQYGSAARNQKWYECLSCWDEESGYGCCVVCAEECHLGHNLVSHESGDFSCDCGANNHDVTFEESDEEESSIDNNVVCTYTTTMKEYVDQPFYRCHTCFTESNKGCCRACVKNCHRGHDIEDSGIRNAFCDCGLECCATRCKIGPKCTYDQYGSAVRNQKWYECLSCWDEESGYGCCVVCADECHSGHNLVSHESGDFSCDCGANSHEVTPNYSIDAICTYTTTKKEYIDQPFYQCHTCFTESNKGCCKACVENCHRGHDIENSEFPKAFCDCGLECCAIRCKIGSKCTYDQYGSAARNQKWYECLSCWDEESGYGCCVVCAEECHLGHNLVSHESGDFSCDCGANNHDVTFEESDEEESSIDNNVVCTYTTTMKEYVDQPFYRCHTCFTESNKGCCRACVKNCHRGHDIEDSGIRNAFCDCGLECCATRCKIGPKCTYDQYGSAVRNQKWYECLSCWDEESGYGCCVVCADECHSGHNLVSHESGDFSCDCGANSHEVTPNYSIDAICTYTTTKKEYIDQPFYQCHTCFTESNKGCCKACVENCHRGHDIENSEFPKAFCDCGLECCAIRCKIGSKCTYDQYGSAARNQKWYECLSCWDEESGYGCCVVCAEECHLGHNLVSHESGDFSCDCGANNHDVTFEESDEEESSIDNNVVCTYTTTMKEYVDQPFYRCHTCFTESNKGCCRACVKNCHRGHDIEDSGIRNAFCDCGLECCATRCKIGPKCTYDQYGSAVRNQKWYECLSCWDEESGYRCCVVCADECHSGHNLVSHESGDFSCDCGANSHEVTPNYSIDAICTYTTTKKEYIDQPFYQCHTCFTESNKGCCKACVENCHRGHDIENSEFPKAFCDCGLECCAIRCKIGSKCTYDQYGSAARNQKWYECLSCWDEESGYGCCVVCAEECHLGHNLVSHESGDFFCDCGANNHDVTFKESDEEESSIDNNVVCTYTITMKEYVDQPFYRCHTCFTESNKGCCRACVENCHRGHDIEDSGIRNAFCDCGLECCAIRCNIGPKCTYDQYGSAVRNQKWYECLSCWGKDSRMGCCEVCANECHSGHELVPHHDAEDFICHCGISSHQTKVCTYYFTGNQYLRQPFYFCHSCFTNPRAGCCYQCMQTCHLGHHISFKGSVDAFCDCGKFDCKITCQIATP